MFVREWRLALIALVVFPFVGVAVRVDRPPALPDQQALAGEDRRAERAPARGVLGDEDRQGVRPRGARGRALRPRQPPAARPGPQGPPHRRDHRAAHGGAGRLRHHGRALVRRPPGHRRRDDARRLLLVHGRAGAALRPRAPALAHHEHRSSSRPRRSSACSRSSTCRRPSPTGPAPVALPGFRERCASRTSAFRYPGSPRPHAARHHARRPPRRGGRLRGHERRRQVDADRPASRASTT